MSAHHDDSMETTAVSDSTTLTDLDAEEPTQPDEITDTDEDDEEVKRKAPIKLGDPRFKLTLYPPLPGGEGRDAGWRVSYYPLLPEGGRGKRKQPTWYGTRDEVMRRAKTLLKDLDARRDSDWRAVTFRELCDRYLADPRHDWEDEVRRSQVYKTDKLCDVGELGEHVLGELAQSQKSMVAALETIAATPSERTGRPPAKSSLKLFRDHLTTVMGWAQKAHVELIPNEYDPVRSLPTPDAQPGAKVAVRDRARAAKLFEDDEDDGEGLIAAGEMPTMDHVRKLGEYWAERSPGRPWWRKLSLDLAATSGLRWGEQHALTVSDILVDQKPPRIRVARKLLMDDTGAMVGTSLPKMGKQRYALIVPGMLGPLVQRCQEVEAEHGRRGLLFPSPDDPTLPYRKDSHDSTFAKYAKRLGWPVDEHKLLLWTFHSLRHRAASHQLNTIGVNPALVSEAMGHKSIRFTLERYVGTSEDTWRQAWARMTAWEAEQDD